MDFVIFLLPTLIILGFLIWFKIDTQKKQKESLENIYNKSLNEALVKLNEISKDSLKSDKESISTDLKNKQDAIEKLIRSIETDLEKRDKELSETRNENMRYFGDIKRQIEEHQKATKDLTHSSEKLTRILGNNKLRGEWGEKILEDILQSSGMEKNIHYLTQEMLASGERPDVVIILPEKRRISIDAKFPLSKILEMTNDNDKTQLAILKKGFEVDVKNRLREIGKREYINSDEGTLDFAIMFVPNEVVFSFINREFPALVEEAFSKKIIIASPFSIYAIARTIMQGYRNYYYEQNIKDVLKEITNFKEQFTRFTDEFSKLGRSFDAVYKDYQKIDTTRVTGMTRTFKKIEMAERESDTKKIQKESAPKLVD
jgi:DNA recombination protein RmuC